VRALLVFLLTSISLVGAQDQVESKLLNKIDASCQSATDCTLVFDECVINFCSCPQTPANIKWVPQCSKGVINVPLPPNVACSMCRPVPNPVCQKGHCVIPKEEENKK
jgi:hypothetical protein